MDPWGQVMSLAGSYPTGQYHHHALLFQQGYYPVGMNSGVRFCADVAEGKRDNIFGAGDEIE